MCVKIQLTVKLMDSLLVCLLLQSSFDFRIQSLKLFSKIQSISSHWIAYNQPGLPKITLHYPALPSITLDYPLPSITHYPTQLERRKGGYLTRLGVVGQGPMVTRKGMNIILQR